MYSDRLNESVIYSNHYFGSIIIIIIIYITSAAHSIRLYVKWRRKMP